MEETPDYLEELEQDLKLFKEPIREVSETIIRDQISQYPVFIAYKEHFPFGELILDKDELETEWSIKASTAEDLIREGVIPLEKAKFFLTHYKSASEYICLFVVPDMKRANFIFVPY
jgi:hypothetical protein